MPGRALATAPARPFFGRERELSDLRIALAEASAGRGRLYLISGEPGIGKTRLSEELSIEADRAGVGVLWGRCWEGGGAPAYWPWVQIVRSQIRREDPTHAFQGRGAGYLAELVGERPPEGREASEEIGVASEDQRFALFDAVAAYLLAAAARTPLLIVLDDLHDADTASLVLLQFIARLLPRARMLVVGTYREVEAELGEAGRLLAGLGREARRLRLAGLNQDEIGWLVDSISGLRPRGEIVQAVARITEGNPFYVDEIVRLLGAGGALGASRSELALQGLRIPEGIRETIRQRLSRLSDRAGVVLSAAAVAGRDFELDVVAAASGLDPGEVRACLAEAATVGAVAESFGPLGRYRFAHALIRETVYEGVPSGDRADLHRRVGESIERLRAGDLEVHLSAVAHHFTVAAQRGDPARAVHYSIEAARKAMSLLAYEEAREHYGHALDALALAEPTNERRRAELLLALGDVQWKEGDAAAARATFLRAAQVARRVDALELLARAAIGYGAGLATQAVTTDADRALIDLLGEALEAGVPPESPLRVRLLARLALELLRTDQADRRRVLSQEAVATARRGGDIRALLLALYARYWVVLGPDSLDERLGLAGEIVLRAGEAGDREMLFWGHHFRARALMELDDFAEVDAETAACAAIAEELRMPLCDFQMRAVASTRALMQGGLGEAERLAAEGLALGPPLLGDVALVAHGTQLFVVRWLQGRLGEEEERLRDLLRSRHWVATWRGAIAYWCTLVGWEAEARTELDRLAAGDFAPLPRDGAWLVALWGAAYTCSLLDDRRRASVLYELLAPFAARNAVIGSASFPAPVSTALGVLAALLGRWDRAEEHFDAGLERSTKIGNLPMALLTLREHAAMLLRRGSPGDAGRAEHLLAEALERGRDSEMPGLEASLRALQPAPTAAPEGLRTARLRFEGEYWSIGFGGETFRLHDRKGLRYLGHLLRQPHREWHVLDLVAAERDGPEASARPDDVAGAGLAVEVGTTETLLDDRAAAAYRRRVADLRLEIEEARSRGEPDREERAVEEIAEISRALTAATGLGGRVRRAPRESERARLAVTKALKAAIVRVGEVSPLLGAHLRATVRTGVFCSYAPDPRSSPTWEL